MNEELNKKLAKACELLQETFKNARAGAIEDVIDTIIHKCIDQKDRELIKQFRDSIYPEQQKNNSVELF